MGLHAILESIRKAGADSVAEIEAHAYAQVHEILASAQLEAGRVREQARNATLEPISHERARLIQRARLEAMQFTGGVRNELVEAAIDQVRGRMANLRTDACYPKVMRSLLLEALSELNGSEQDASSVQDNETICLEASLSDQALLESLMQSLNLELPVRYSLKCWGGLVAKSKDGRIVVINTIEARLERAIPHLRRDLAALFESDQLDAGFNQPVEDRSATKS